MSGAARLAWALLAAVLLTADGGLLQTPDYPPDDALRYLHYSNAAYCPGPTLQNWSCPPCRRVPAAESPTVVWSATTGMQAYVTATAAEVVVAFKGTSDLTNWMYDLTFRKVKVYPLCAGCLVHSGFWETWGSVRPQVMAAIQQRVQARPGTTVTVTGHSLGAAVAVLCTLELHVLEKIPVSAVYTYGLPRVGNDAFADFHMQLPHPSWRVTHWRDPVPHLPVRVMGFHHIIREVFYNYNSSQYILCSETGEDPSGSNRFDLTLNINDHLNYLGIPTGTAACDPRAVVRVTPEEWRRLEDRVAQIGRDAEARQLP